MNIQNIVTAPEVAAYWDVKAKELQPYFGESKFPNQKKLGMKLEWLKGAQKAPVALSLSALDADVIPLTRGTLEIINTKMPFFKNSYRIDEELRQELNMIQESNSAALKIMVGRIFDDASALMRNAALTREIMRMQLLTTGVISLSDNGQKYTYDYNIPTAHKITPTTKWSVTASADPVADIMAWQQVIADETGNMPTELLMNSKTLDALLKTDAVKNGIFARSNTVSIPTPEEAKAYLSGRLGVTIYVYDKGYTKNNVWTKFVPDGTVVLMPSAPLGNTWFGTTPEESDLMSGTNAECRVVDTGVALTTWKVVDPVTVEIKGSQIVMPSFELADEVIIASVL